MKSRTIVAAIVAAGGLGSALWLGVLMGTEQPTAGDALELDPAGFVEPARNSPAPPVIPDPPALPPHAETLPPLTFRIVTAATDDVPATPAGAPVRSSQRVARTRDRVWLASDDIEKEWLFRRNPVDPRRVSGYLTDHATKTILVYDETDLRITQGLRGWLDVVTMRIDPAQVEALPAGQGSAHVAGWSFTHHAATASEAPLEEIWWSDELLLPQRFVLRESGRRVTSTIEQLTLGIDEGMLQDPDERFPDYRMLELADARESMH
ncbi:MAG: hypothetical protein AB7G23_11665 [Vicinamibacterales bacterium]